MRDMDYLSRLKEKSPFDREDLLREMQIDSIDVEERNIKWTIEKLLNDGAIGRVGRNAYLPCDQGIAPYTYEYTDLAKNIGKIISEAYPNIDFRLMELVQLNEFLNHQRGQNIIILSVEANLEKFVFELLRNKHSGRILLSPSADEFNKYLEDNMIVITKLSTEAPRDKGNLWGARLEKILVDLMRDKLLKTIIDKSEIPKIFEDAFDRYIIDESTMFRYARRRGGEHEVKNMIKNETTVKLRLGDKNND